jgi:hypothetical protein
VLERKKERKKESGAKSPHSKERESGAKSIILARAEYIVGSFPFLTKLLASFSRVMSIKHGVAKSLTAACSTHHV